MNTAVSSSMLRNATIMTEAPPFPGEIEQASAADSGEFEVEPAAARGPSRRYLSGMRRSMADNRWPLSLAASVVLHGCAVAAMMVDWPFLAHDETLPPATMVVELAIVPASPVAPVSEIPPGPEQVEAAPKPTPLDKMKFDPPPQVDPVLKPAFALPAQQRIQPLESQVVAREARETTAPQAVPAPIEDISKAPVEGNNAAPPSDAEQAWEGRILARLERNKRYPAQAQSAGHQGTVLLRLVLDRRGRLLGASLKSSGGYALLESETLALARRASPYPAPPASVLGEQIVRIVPVEFYIKK